MAELWDLPFPLYVVYYCTSTNYFIMQKWGQTMMQGLNQWPNHDKQWMRVNGQNHKQWEWQWEWSNESWQAMRVNGQNHKQWAYLWFLILSYEDRNIEGFHDINPFKMDLMHAPWSHRVPWAVMSPKLPHVPQGRGRCRGGNWNS